MNFHFNSSPGMRSSLDQSDHSRPGKEKHTLGLSSPNQSTQTALDTKQSHSYHVWRTASSLQPKFSQIWLHNIIGISHLKHTAHLHTHTVPSPRERGQADTALMGTPTPTYNVVRDPQSQPAHKPSSGLQVSWGRSDRISVTQVTGERTPLSPRLQLCNGPSTHGALGHGAVQHGRPSRESGAAQLEPRAWLSELGLRCATNQVST